MRRSSGGIVSKAGGWRNGAAPRDWRAWSVTWVVEAQIWVPGWRCSRPCPQALPAANSSNTVERRARIFIGIAYCRCFT